MTHNSPERPHLLPVRGLNEIFIGESLSSRYMSLPTILWRWGTSRTPQTFPRPFVLLHSMHPLSPPPISPYLWISVCHRLKYKSFKPHLTLSLHRASYYEISIDDGPWEKQKSSGLSVCTGTGSKAWWVRALFYSSDLTTPHKNVKIAKIIFVPLSRSYNINKLVEQAVEDVLRIG